MLAARSVEITLPKELPLVVRLDGCSFRVFTRRFQRPFDPRSTLAAAVAVVVAVVVVADSNLAQFAMP